MKGEAEAKRFTLTSLLRLLMQLGFFKHDLMQAQHSKNPADTSKNPSRPP